jgi:hypothetical protein
MESKDRKKLTLEERRHEALRNPLRSKIMRLLITEGPKNPARMARTLEEPLDDVNYHTKRLVELGCAELVGEEKVGSTLAHVYRATERYLIETDEWDDLHPLLKDFHATQFAQSHIHDLVLGFEAGTLGTHRHFDLSQKRIVVDEQGRDEVLAIKARAMEDVQQAEARAAGRRGGYDDEGIHMSVLQAAFEIPPSD